MLDAATRKFLKESWQATHSIVQTLHGYIYLRWPVWYIKTLRRSPDTPVAEESGAVRFLSPGWWLQFFPADWMPRFKRWFATGYHGKVLAPGTATRLIRIERDLAQPQPETVLPYARARDIILNENAPVALIRCPCRESLPHHCEPVDVCILVGESVVDFALAHHPTKSRRVTPEEAVDVVRRCNERGLVTHAFFKSAVMDRFYAICNCCTCCCGAMSAHLKGGVPMLCASGEVARIDAAACTRCGKCVRRCPFGAIRMEEGPVVDAAACMGCGVCVLACPAKALRLETGGNVKPLVL